MSHVSSISIPPSLQSSPVHRRHCDFEGGDTVSPAEAGNLSDPSLNKGILLQYVHGPQERWRSDTCYQSETPEQICVIRGFQNGGATYSQGSFETE